MSPVLAHPIGSATIGDRLVRDQPADGSRLELIMGHFHVTPLPSGRHQWVTAPSCGQC
jgi:hypothetical protein